jgi:FixJ family two-component response regulator
MVMTPEPTHPLIAIVEDDGAVRHALQFCLEAEGYDVCAFPSPSEALASCRLRQADCMVIDYGLPGMDGLDLMRALRSRQVACPAIIITGGALTLRCRMEADAAGAQVLEKPLIGEALSRVIRAALKDAALH